MNAARKSALWFLSPSCRITRAGSVNIPPGGFVFGRILHKAFESIFERFWWLPPAERSQPRACDLSSSPSLPQTREEENCPDAKNTDYDVVLIVVLKKEKHTLYADSGPLLVTDSWLSSAGAAECCESVPGPNSSGLFRLSFVRKGEKKNPKYFGAHSCRSCPVWNTTEVLNNPFQVFYLALYIRNNRLLRDF